MSINPSFDTYIIPYDKIHIIEKNSIMKMEENKWILQK